MKVSITLIFTFLLTTCQYIKHNAKQVPVLTVSDAYAKNIEAKKLVTGWYYVSDEPTDFERVLDQSSEKFFLNPEPIATQSDFAKIEAYHTDFENEEDNYAGLIIQLGGDAIARWSKATRNSVNRNLGLIINDQLVHAPKVNSEIMNGMTVINRTEFNASDIENFEKELKK